MPIRSWQCAKVPDERELLTDILDELIVRSDEFAFVAFRQRDVKTIVNTDSHLRRDSNSAHSEGQGRHERRGAWSWRQSRTGPPSQWQATLPLRTRQCMSKLEREKSGAMRAWI